MELAKEILVKSLEGREIAITFPDLKIDVAEVINTQSYQALQKIKTIMEDDSLSDFDCIEKIICIFEEIGSDGGRRHDFG